MAWAEGTQTLTTLEVNPYQSDGCDSWGENLPLLGPKSVIHITWPPKRRPKIGFLGGGMSVPLRNVMGSGESKTLVCPRKPRSTTTEGTRPQGLPTKGVLLPCVRLLAARNA